MASLTASHEPFDLKRMSKITIIPYHIDIHSCGSKRTFMLNHEKNDKVAYHYNLLRT